MNTTAIIRRPPSTFHCTLHITITLTLLFLTGIKAATIETTQQQCYTDENGICSNDDQQEHLLCIDHLPECIEYASNEEEDPCVYTSYFMYHNCPKSCGACEYAVYLDYYNEVVSLLRSECFDDDENCEDWADAGECEDNPEFMIDNCRESCNVCVATDEEMGNVEQHFFEDDEELHKAIMEHSERMEEYFEKEVLIDPFYDNVRSKCVNLNPECLYWAVTGECEPEPDKHYAYMMGNCPLACLSCEMVDVKNRCPLPENEVEVNAYGPGDLDNMFRGIADGNWDQYSPVIHSAPSDYFERKNKKSKVDDSNVKLGGPWIVTFENFLTELEAAQMIVLGYEQGFERSTDVGSMKLDGSYTNSESTGRTSENAWCTDECGEHITAKTICELCAYAALIVGETDFQFYTPSSTHCQCDEDSDSKQRTSSNITLSQ